MGIVNVAGRTARGPMTAGFRSDSRAQSSVISCWHPSWAFWRRYFSFTSRASEESMHTSFGEEESPSEVVAL